MEVITMAETQQYNYYNLESYFKKKNVIGTTYRNMLDIIDLYTTQFKVNGLDKYNFTSDILFSALLFNNHLCFYYLNGIDSLVLCKYVDKSTFDYYYKPTKVDLYSISGYLIAQDIPYSDIVLIKDNTLDITPFIYLDEYVEILQNIENTLNVNLTWLKFPMIFESDKKTSVAIKNLFKDIKYNFTPYVITNYGALDGIKSTQVNLSVKPNELYQLYEAYYNKCLNSLGISSSISKRERLITDEMQAQNDMVNARYFERKNNLLKAIELIKEKWNINLTLEESYIESIKVDNDLEVEKENAIESGDNNG